MYPPCDPEAEFEGYSSPAIELEPSSAEGLGISCEVDMLYEDERGVAARDALQPSWMSPITSRVDAGRLSSTNGRFSCCPVGEDVYDVRGDRVALGVGRNVTGVEPTPCA